MNKIIRYMLLIICFSCLAIGQSANARIEFSCKLGHEDINNCFRDYYFSLCFSYANGENGYTKDYRKAIDECLTACLHNKGEACNILAGFYDNGNGVEKNYTDALYYFEKACNLNYGNGCSNLGSMYYKGKGVSQDYQKAKLYYDKACSLGNKKACKMKFNNNSFSFEESCHRGNGNDCYTAGFYYEKGSNGYARNYTQAKTHYDKACNLKNKEGCHALGVLFVEGMGVNEDFNTAKFYFKKACDLGRAESCVFYRELK